MLAAPFLDLLDARVRCDSRQHSGDEAVEQLQQAFSRAGHDGDIGSTTADPRQAFNGHAAGTCTAPCISTHCTTATTSTTVKSQDFLPFGALSLAVCYCSPFLPPNSYKRCVVRCVRCIHLPALCTSSPWPIAMPESPACRMANLYIYADTHST